MTVGELLDILQYEDRSKRILIYDYDAELIDLTELVKSNVSKLTNRSFDCFIQSNSSDDLEVVILQ